MSESTPVWGPGLWAIEIAKQLKPSLQSITGDYSNNDLEYLGEGQYSIVVRVRDYAVKLFIPRDYRNSKENPDKNLEGICRNFLLKEYGVLKRLNTCPYVVPYIDRGEGQVHKALFPTSIFYLVTEVKGRSLDKFLNPRESSGGMSKLTVYQCLDVAIQSLRAIEYGTTHVQIDSHRDLALDNITVKILTKGFPSNLGDPLQVFVLDYGIARIQEIDVPRLEESPFFDKEFPRWTLPWEAWFPGTGPKRFGIHTDTYSVGMILLYLLLLARHENPETRGLLELTAFLGDLRKSFPNLSDDGRKTKFEQLFKLYLPVIDLGEGLVEENPTSPTQQLRGVLRRALAFGSLDIERQVVFGNNERYDDATAMINELNAIRLDLFYRQARQYLERRDPNYTLYEDLKRRLEMAMRWDSPEDEVAWNLFGKKLFDLGDEEAAYSCFSEAIRISEQSGRPFPKAYRNRAKLCDVVAAFATSESKAKLYENRAEADRKRAKEAEARQASVPPPTDVNPTTQTKNK